MPSDLSLSRLLSESPLLQATGRTTAEASVFQALKDYGTGCLELELKLTNSARNRQKAGSGSLYNIRRVDWESLRTKVDPDRLGTILWDRSEEAWNKRTAYVVCNRPSHILVVLALVSVVITTLLTDSLLGKYTTCTLVITSGTFVHPLLHT
jgi:hypothetical protein